MSDFDRLYERFQALAGALDGQLTARERLAALAQSGSLSANDLRTELALHEEALRIAGERRAELTQRLGDASGYHARTDRERYAALLAEIDREVPLIQDAIHVLRDRLAAMDLASS